MGPGRSILHPYILVLRNRVYISPDISGDTMVNVICCFGECQHEVINIVVQVIICAEFEKNSVGSVYVTEATLLNKLYLSSFRDKIIPKWSCIYIPKQRAIICNRPAHAGGHL